MNIFVNSNKLLYTIRIWGIFTAIWPLDFEVGKFKTSLYQIFWYICLVNMTNQCYSLFIKSIFPFEQNDFVNMLKTVVELVISAEGVFNLLYCRIRRQQFQKLLFEFEQYVRLRTPYEKTVREKFMHNIYVMYLSLITIYIIGLSLFALSPLITDRCLPLNVVYPFPLSKFWLYCVAYTMNLFSIIQLSIVIVVDTVTITILWQAAFKFNLLGTQMRSAITVGKLRACIITYQNIFNYVWEINSVVSYILFKLTIVTSINVICSSLLILNNAPMVDMSIFLIITFTSILRFFVCCWSAQAVIDMSSNVSWQIYNSPWMNASTNLRRTIFMTIQRSQKPIVISGTNFIPIISIRFCGKVLYTTFSYFMALRTILH